MWKEELASILWEELLEHIIINNLDILKIN